MTSAFDDAPFAPDATWVRASEDEIYTEEEPNALTSEETASFLGCMKEEFPAQYAMTFLGFVTGLRPSCRRIDALRHRRRQGDPQGPLRIPAIVIA
jgi:hypothetical protein